MQVGDELRLPAGENKVSVTAWMRSIVPVDHFQVVCNGEVVSDFKLSDRQSADMKETIPISRSGWCLARAYSDKAEHPILDIYPYATTSPIYVTIAGSKPKAGEDAAFFMAWIDRLISAANANTDWNTAAEKSATLDLLTYARKVYEGMQK
jgi:TolB protein